VAERASAMLRYTSPRLTQAVASALPHALQEEDTAALNQCQEVSSVSLKDVQMISRLLRSSKGDPDHWVHQLLHEAKPLLPTGRAKAAPHPDLEPRLKRLRAAQEDREYAQMIGTSMKDEDSASRDAAEMSTFRSQLGVN